MAKIYFSLVVLIFNTQLFAASCCGGGQSASSLIIGDHLQEWSAAALFRSDIGQTNNKAQALMDSNNNKDTTFTTNIEYKKLIHSRFQSNLSISFIHKESKRLGMQETSKGIGDVGPGVFYEAVTDYSYNAWQPRLFVGAKLIIPFGQNNFNSKKVLRTDIRGSGFYKFDLPIIANRKSWKLSATPQYLPRQKSLSSSYAFSTAGTYTYSVSDQIDFATTLQWNYLAKKTFQYQTLVSGQYWDLTLSPSWMINLVTAVNLSYTDSTLIGKSRNSALYRSLAVGITLSELL